MKGGVGKTHLCWLLASVCEERGKRCLIVDLDARYDLAQPEQWEAERLHTALADVLVEIAPAYDYVLLDCPPRISLASYAALCASDYVVIPLEAADWGARGTATVRAAIERVQQHDNPDLKLLGYVVSKFKQRRTFQMAAPRKNTAQSAELAAQAALARTPQLSLGGSQISIPARQDGRVPLRNTYRIELALIEPDPNQPRQHFDADALQELADSIKARDVRQPLSVRWEPTSRRYRIIDGERRFRAAAQVGIRDVPCIISEGEAKEVLVDQIVQNWQRADLRPYETADALVRLKQEFAMPVSEIAAMTGKSVGEVSKLIALVERVAPDVQERVRQLADASLTKRHLYALMQLEPHHQMRMAHRIEREQLTAADTERLVRAGLDFPSTQARPSRGRPRKHDRHPATTRAPQLDDSPLYEPLSRIGFEPPTIRRIVSRFTPQLVQQWSDITLAAMERGMIKKSPQSFFMHYIQEAKERRTTPPDWWHELQRREREQHRSEEQAVRQTDTDEAFDDYLRTEAREAFHRVMDRVFRGLCDAGQAEREAREHAEYTARIHMRQQFRRDYPEKDHQGMTRLGDLL